MNQQDNTIKKDSKIDAVNPPFDVSVIDSATITQNQITEDALAEKLALYFVSLARTLHQPSKEPLQRT